MQVSPPKRQGSATAAPPCHDWRSEQETVRQQSSWGQRHAEHDDDTRYQQQTIKSCPHEEEMEEEA